MALQINFKAQVLNVRAERYILQLYQAEIVSNCVLSCRSMVLPLLSKCVYRGKRGLVWVIRLTHLLILWILKMGNCLTSHLTNPSYSLRFIYNYLDLVIHSPSLQWLPKNSQCSLSDQNQKENWNQSGSKL